MSGDLQVGFNYIPTFVPNVQQGSIRGLAVTSLKRLPDLPNVPTVDEQGFPGFEATGWNALLAPAGTPREIIDKLNAAVNAYLNSQQGKDQIRKLVMVPMGGSPADAQAFLDRERVKWVPIIKEANITLQ
jgi:tripartite-type tricarboxylate transporter receptor subunit TctC